MKQNINNDIPIEEVNKVIEESNDEDDEDDSNPKGDYVDLSEEAAKKELDGMIIPGSDDGDGEEPELVINNTILAEKEKSVKPVSLNLLQFQCDECNFKTYVNLDDEIISPLSEKIRCLNCGKKKSVKKRILNTTLNGFTNYKKQEEEPYIDPELDEEDSTEL